MAKQTIGPIEARVLQVEERIKGIEQTMNEILETVTVIRAEQVLALRRSSEAEFKAAYKNAPPDRQLLAAYLVTKNPEFRAKIDKDPILKQVCDGVEEILKDYE